MITGHGFAQISTDFRIASGSYYRTECSMILCHRCQLSEKYSIFHGGLPVFSVSKAKIMAYFFSDQKVSLKKPLISNAQGALKLTPFISPPPRGMRIEKVLPLPGDHGSSI